MKTRLLIIIGISIVTAISLSYYAIYDSSTTVFISCDPRYEQIDDKCVLKISEIDYEELECLRLYKDIREISRTDGMALAERETIDMHKSLVFEYVEKNCPDFPDLEFIYNSYKQNIPEPETWINIRIEDLTRNVEIGSSPTFRVVESGWGNSCTSPTLEVYHMKQKVGNDYTSDDLIYKHHIVYPCPYYQPVNPPPEVLRIWDEIDFPGFPICEEQGRFLIVGDSGYERHALDDYYCGVENEN